MPGDDLDLGYSTKKTQTAVLLHISTKYGDFPQMWEANG